MPPLARVSLARTNAKLAGANRPPASVKTCLRVRREEHARPPGQILERMAIDDHDTGYCFRSTTSQVVTHTAVTRESIEQKFFDCNNQLRLWLWHEGTGAAAEAAEMR